MEKLHKSMAAYVKSIARKNDGNDRDKSSPVGYMGTTMINHGEDFEPDSEFGNCLMSMLHISPAVFALKFTHTLSGFGRAQERVGRAQEVYATQATSTWLETLEKSLAQMKEYQVGSPHLQLLSYPTLTVYSGRS